ncbi:MAG: hypothetical protein ACTSW1_18030 [Candidatus Hodarchaeales archaeon]
MKYKLACKVESLAFIEKPISFEIENKEYKFKPNRNGFLSKIEITKKVENPEEHLAKIIPHAHGKGHHKLEIKSDKNILEKLKEEMQYLEATIMFNGSTIKINWENPDQGWIPETEEDKKRINVIQISHERGYPKRETKLDEVYLKSVIEERKDYDELTILQAFYNDGVRFFHEFKYINAFYNFYFVIEDLYGDGNTKNSKIMKSFKQSKDLREIIEKVMNNHILNHKKHSKSINKFLKDMSKTTSNDNIIEFLVLTRGRLHHFSRKSSLKTGTPFNQQEYETIAFLVMGIALHGILKEILYINQELGIAEKE